MDETLLLFSHSPIPDSGIAANLSLIMVSSAGSSKSIVKESPGSSEGLQIAEPEVYPEAVNRYTPTRDTKLPQLHDQSSPDAASICTRTSQERVSFHPGPRSDQSGSGTTIEVPPDMLKKFCAHRWRKFCFLVVFTLFIVGTFIGSSIGGALYVQDKAGQYVGLEIFFLVLSSL